MKRKFLVEVIIDDPRQFNNTIGGPIDDDTSMNLTIEGVIEEKLSGTGLECEVLHEIEKDHGKGYYEVYDKRGNPVVVHIPSKGE
jgi:hypothetical protein